MAAMLLTEAIAHAQGTKETIYLTFMDASKALDLIDHDWIMNHLYNQGIQDYLWHLFDSLHMNITSVIK